MSTTTTIIAIIGVVSGFLTQAIQTGSFLGLVLPKVWLPYLTTAAVFLAAFVMSLMHAGSVVTWANVFDAVIAGLTALTGTAVGVTVHQHLNAKPSPAPANDNAKANSVDPPKAA